MDISHLSKIDVDQFYGIEIEEFPVRIAEAAMWLVDHQMNMRLSDAFGQVFVRLPLQKSAHIHNENALTTEWSSLLPPDKCSYILGNPPFVGSKFMTREQRQELLEVFVGIKGVGVLDYVSAWYGKAAQYIQDTKIKVAFVSTNSITQGEQVSALWDILLDNYGIKIHFAHRTFKWTIDDRKAKGMRVAAVYVIIIGLAVFDIENKYIYDYEILTSDPHRIQAKKINPYLVDGPNTNIGKRSNPICNVPNAGIGNKPIDNGNYLFTSDEKDQFIKNEPLSKGYFQPWIGADEFLNNKSRWCLWLGNCPPDILKKMPYALERVEAVREYRLKSKSQPTRKIADIPTRFHVENMPESDFLVIPRVSSEKRRYIPIGFFDSKTIVSDATICVQKSNLYHFGILSSLMHMTWVRYVCGRLKSDYRYSSTLVYNNYPWPEPAEKHKITIEEKAQAVLDARKQFPDSALADLYDPNTMPRVLLKAHQELDKAVDKAYRSKPFKNEKERIEFLFDLYQKLTEPLIPKERKKKRKK